MDSSSIAHRSRITRVNRARAEQAYANAHAFAHASIDQRTANRRRWLAAGVGVLAASLALPAIARRPTTPTEDRFAVAGTSAAEVRPFIASLQKAVAMDDRRAVTRMFFYPSRIWAGERSETVLRRSDVSDQYDTIFDKSLRLLIADAHWETLFANWRGVALGDGRLWFARITTQQRLAITAINGPVGLNGHTETSGPQHS